MQRMQNPFYIIIYKTQIKQIFTLWQESFAKPLALWAKQNLKHIVKSRI